MKDKNKKNSYGTFVVSGKRSLVRRFMWAFFAVIFVLGIGLILFSKFNGKPVTKALVEESTTKADVSKIPGWWNQQYFGSSVCEKNACLPDADPDDDGLTNLQEFYYHTNPIMQYTVQDKLNDGELVAAGFDPSKPGHMTFEQVSTPENLLGESLAFDSDVRKIVADLNDLNKVSLPLVKDSQLQIVDSRDSNAYSTYPSRFKSAIDKYFSQSDLDNIKGNLKDASDGDLDDIKLKSEGLAMELKTIPVPIQFMAFHKYSIALFELLPEVIAPPVSLSSAESDVWFDRAQAFFAIQQKLDAEQTRLRQLTPANP